MSDLGGATAYLYNGRLFVKSFHTLYALHPENGKVLWAFCPYGTRHETMYSSPTGHQGRIYIGDRKGFLHCLDAAAGQTFWKFRTSRARDCEVNSTPLIASGSVMVTTNAKSAIACDPATGRLNWRQRLDALSAFGPMSWRGLLVAKARSVYFLDPHSGEIRRCLRLRNNGARFVECTPDSVIVVVKGDRPLIEMSNLVLLSKSGTERNIPIAGFCLGLRYSAEKRLLYATLYGGEIDLVHPVTADILCKLKPPGIAYPGMAHPGVKGDAIYTMTGGGHVYALKHPPIP